MSEHITAVLKKKLDDLAAFGEIDSETRFNALKEELQYYVLNFIYHHPEYSSWIMYGGSALRIIHKLNRMSVDLDFEISKKITVEFLGKLKSEIEEYFLKSYNAGADFLTVTITTGRGVKLKFHVGEELSFGHPSKQVHVKIDLNHFVAPKTVTERWPINRDQLSFVILTYKRASLMASKIAAIFLRGTRGVGKALYEEKGRDIYDLLWYMNKKIVPDFDYLIAKGIDVKDPRALFDKLTIQMNKVSEKNLKQDLMPLFIDQTSLTNWLENWRESYLRLLDDYKIRTVTELVYVVVGRDRRTDNVSFHFIYTTEEGSSTRITYRVTNNWITDREGALSMEGDERIKKMIEYIDWEPKRSMQDTLNQYATLFYRKTEAYFRKTNRVMLGNNIVTKLIRMTSNNLNRNEQIVLNKSALLSCELDDLLK